MIVADAAVQVIPATHSEWISSVHRVGARAVSPVGASGGSAWWASDCRWTAGPEWLLDLPVRVLFEHPGRRTGQRPAHSGVVAASPPPLPADRRAPSCSVRSISVSAVARCTRPWTYASFSWRRANALRWDHPLLARRSTTCLLRLCRPPSRRLRRVRALAEVGKPEPVEM